MDENNVEAVHGEGIEFDLRDRLRFAAGSLAADFGDQVPIHVAEELVFSSAEGLLAAASVTDFVPILAERKARQAVRSGTAVPSTPPASAPPPASAAPPACAPPRTAAPASPPLLAVPDDALTRLRDDVERARMRVAEWRANLTRR